MALESIGWNSADTYSTIAGSTFREDFPAAVQLVGSIGTYVLSSTSTERRFAIFELTAPTNASAVITSASFKNVYGSGGVDPSQYSLWAVPNDVPMDGTHPNWDERLSGTNWGTAGAFAVGDRGASAIAVATTWADTVGTKPLTGAALNSYLQTQIRAGAVIRLLVTSENGVITLVGGTGSDGSRPKLEYDITSGGAATKVTFTTEPANTVVGATMANVVVTAQDASNATDTSYTGNVTLELRDGSGPLAGLLGTLTVAAVAGVGTFSTLAHNTIRTGVFLRASSGALATDDSATFNFTVGGGGAVLGSPFKGGPFS